MGKKIIALLMAGTLTASLCACGNSEVTEPQRTVPSEEPTQTESADVTMLDEPVQAQAGKVLRGEDTGNAGTYTGYEPLPEVTLTVEDPENTAGLSTKKLLTAMA